MLVENESTELGIPPAGTVEEVCAHTRRKPRLPIPEKLPRVDIELLPIEVKEKGLEAFERVSGDVMERRPASLVGPPDRSGPRSRVRPGRWP
jgi:hypothetical protein